MKTLLFAFLFILFVSAAFSQNVGIGTLEPVGRLQINHRSSPGNPTLNLFDSSSIGGPNILFRNGGSTKSWQFRAYLNQAVANNDYLDIVQNDNIIATFGNGSNFGLGALTPTEKLDVVGNIKLTGEVNRVATGTAHLLPIAYGNISAGAFINSSSSNITAVSKIGIGWYQITIVGESYQFQTYTTVVTPVGSSGAIITSTGSGAGNLYVYTYNAAGVATDSQFCFVVHKQ